MKNLLREEYTKVWGNSEKMINYCVNKVATIAELPNGGIVTIDKQSIEKDFCFGESGYDYDDAQAMAEHARKSEEYFKAENMRHFNAWIKDLEETLSGEGDYKLLIHDRQYSSQTDDCRLVGVTWARFIDVIDACGGSVYSDELGGKRITFRGVECRIATNEELQIILDAYKVVARAHEKKIDSYLKRYGTSKVHAWTYWRDA